MLVVFCGELEMESLDKIVLIVSAAVFIRPRRGSSEPTRECDFMATGCRACEASDVGFYASSHIRWDGESAIEQQKGAKIQGW